MIDPLIEGYFGTPENCVLGRNHAGPCRLNRQPHVRLPVYLARLATGKNFDGSTCPVCGLRVDYGNHVEDMCCLTCGQVTSDHGPSSGPHGARPCPVLPAEAWAHGWWGRDKQSR